ncbi:MAG TPA: ABC transporter substrate-binding protein [Acidimicrobiales bacterium]|nr:ABC transporter substrate-binding protein [Acidimicrobiales bacterium]
MTTNLLAKVRRSARVRVAAGTAAVALLLPLALGSTANAAVHAGTVPNVTVVMGTTDRIVSADPAGSYDLPSWTIIWNVFQTLVKYPPGSTRIVPDAANCHWQGSGATVYVCTLLPNQYFSNGDPVTGQDVVYSFERVNKINSPNGASSLLTPMKSVKASGNTVTFVLKYADATWPDVLTTGVGAIVDAKVFPFDKLQPDAAIIGSGPYELKSYTPNQLAVFVPNPHYGGNDVLANKEFIIRYEESATTLVSDVQSGAVNVGYRDLTPTQLIALGHSRDVTVVKGQGIEIRYMVFNLKVMPGSTPAQKLAIRQAIAYLLNRQDITTNIYHGIVSPLYSIIPDALPGHINSFAQVYGATPNPAKAKGVLSAAGVKVPVKFTLWYNTNHYQDTDMATEIQRQLNASGLFDVSLSSAEWTTYDKAATTDQYGVYFFGWFPDYPDADDYSLPFYSCTPFMVDHYCNATVVKDIAKEEGSTVQSVRDAAFSQLQIQTAKDAPLVPLWQGGQVAAVHGTVTGLRQTLDASYIFRFWLVGKP